jgi:hypothetical protein
MEHYGVNSSLQSHLMTHVSQKELRNPLILIITAWTFVQSSARGRRRPLNFAGLKINIVMDQRLASHSGFFKAPQVRRIQMRALAFANEEKACTLTMAAIVSPFSTNLKTCA